MPNGGAPMHLLICPEETDVGILCEFGKMWIVRYENTESGPRAEETIIELDPFQARAIVKFLRYWWNHGERLAKIPGKRDSIHYGW